MNIITSTKEFKVLSKYIFSTDITDILYNGIGKHIYVIMTNGTKKRYEIDIDENGFISFVRNLASDSQKQLHGKSLSYTTVLIVRSEKTNKNIYARIKVIIAPRAAGVKNAPIIAIRLANSRNLTISQYFESVTKKTKSTQEIIERAVLDHRNILIAGATGAGKTTLFNAILQLVDSEERCIIVEDIPELIHDSQDVVRLSVKTGTQEEFSEVLDDALRLSPDRILINELLTGNTFPFFTILSSGHSGTITTLHANSAKLIDIIRKLNFNALAAGFKFNDDVIMSLIEKTTLIIHLQRIEDGICVTTN